MPMMAAYEQNDARDAARQLASRTLQGLSGTPSTPLMGNAINNMFRLLQSYSAHRFYGFVDPIGSDTEDAMSSLLTSTDRNVVDLREALDATFDSYCGEDKDLEEFVDEMRGVLRIIAFPEKNEFIDDDERKRVKAFFETLLSNLKV